MGETHYYLKASDVYDQFNERHGSEKAATHHRTVDPSPEGISSHLQVPRSIPEQRQEPILR